MTRRFLFNTGWLLLALCSGCVERRYVILTNVPGTVVLENNKYVGPAPAERPFRYYGNYRFTLLADGYEPKIVDECFKTPWYEYFPLDFVTENLLPFVIRDVRVLQGPSYLLTPIQAVPPEMVKARAEELRFKGQGLGDAPPPSIQPGTLPLPAQTTPPIEVAPPPNRLIQPIGPAVPQVQGAPPTATALPPAPREQPTPTWTPSR